MNAAKELNHSDVPFIYSFFKTIVAQASDKFDRSQTDQIFYATRHAKLTFRPKFHIFLVEFNDATIYYEVKSDVACIFCLDEDLPTLNDLEELFAMILRDIRL